jgi:hypothetical protein
MYTDCQDRILLTGAGFTKNFGAPLAKELWSIILSNPVLDSAPEVRRILLNDFDFESVYNTVMRGARLPIDDDGGWERQRDALGTAVNDAYGHIDAKIREFTFHREAPHPINLYKVQEFIASFSGNAKNPGFFFTLNQDLFIERHYYNGPRPTLPGIIHSPTWFGPDGNRDLAAERREIPESRGSDQILDGSPFYYVKLHGSSNWYSADKQTMVIGQAKQDQIASQPILAKYFDVFQSVLSAPGGRLLCVGYSFSDDHINEAIWDGLRKGLRLYVLSPESPDSLKKRPPSKDERGNAIWGGLAGYFQYDLRTLFPADQSITAEWKMIHSRFFGAT